jgi:hypothetical protein
MELVLIAFIGTIVLMAVELSDFIGRARTPRRSGALISHRNEAAMAAPREPSEDLYDAAA